MIRIGKTFRFEAAHHLPNHDGKCRRPHGHSYKVLVELEGPLDVEYGGAKEGMVVDFSDVSAFWKQNLEPMLDHHDLNATLQEAGLVRVTTAENIAAWLLGEFLSWNRKTVAVTVWETETSWARAT